MDFLSTETCRAHVSADASARARQLQSRPETLRVCVLIIFQRATCTFKPPARACARRSGGRSYQSVSLVLQPLGLLHVVVCGVDSGKSTATEERQRCVCTDRSFNKKLGGKKKRKGKRAAFCFDLHNQWLQAACFGIHTSGLV